MRANSQDDEVMAKVIQQGNLALPGKKCVCPACQQANPLLHQFRAGLSIGGRKRHHSVLSERAVVSRHTVVSAKGWALLGSRPVALTWRRRLHSDSLKVNKHVPLDVQKARRGFLGKVQCPIMRGHSMQRTSSAVQIPQGMTMHGCPRSGSGQQGKRR